MLEDLDFSRIVKLGINRRRVYRQNNMAIGIAKTFLEFPTIANSVGHLKLQVFMVFNFVKKFNYCL